MSDLEYTIRQAISAEADERVDPRTVMAQLHKRKHRPFGLMIATAATVVAVAVTVAVIVPRAEPKITTAAAPTTKTVLLLGTDNEDRPDSIVLARVDDKGGLSAISFPRDVMFNGAKLNASPDIVKTVSELSGVKIDHWAKVRMSDFVKVADAVGGIEVCLSAAVTDPRTGLNLPGGKQTLKGEQALAYLRQRYGLERGDLDRVTTLQAAIASMSRKLALTPDKVDEIVRAVTPHVRVDDGFDVLAFAKQVNLGAGTRTTTIPVKVEAAANKAHFEVDAEQTKKYVADFHAQSGPAPAPSPKPGC